MNFENLFGSMLDKVWFSVYEGDGTDDKGGADDKGGTDDKGKDKTFTQSDVDKIVTAEKEKVKRNYANTITELEKVKKTANLSQEQVESLTVQIDTLKRESMTKEELAKEELAKKENEYGEKLKTTESEKESWKARYTEESISRALMDAAITNDAFNPEQIIAIMRPNTRLEEEIKDGKKTGKYITKVTVNTVDKDKKPITLDLSASDAVKKLKENQAYANLFKSSIKNGIHLNNVFNPNGPDNKPLSTAEYIKARNESRKGKV